jgi:serine/threonine protein kinase
MVEQRSYTSTCGPYTILQTIGEGGNAVIKLVEKDGAQYAMKIFLLEGQEHKEIIRKTKHEFEVVKSLDIKGVMKYHEFNEKAVWTNRKGDKKDVCYLVMELVKGVELLEFINEYEDKVSDSTIRYIFHKIANVIHQLHKAGIAHRDIKLENIMLTDDFDIKIIDLGYALALSGRSNSGFMKTRLGTYMYMAPEILDKTLQYQGQDADLFALGVCLFVAKVTEYPWKRPDIETDQSYRTFACNHGMKSGKFWAQFEDQKLSKDFKNLIELMLAYDPTSRATMVDFLGHKWMRGEVDTKEDFERNCKKYLDAAKAYKEGENEAYGIDHAVSKVRRSDKKFQEFAANIINVNFRPAYNSGKVKYFTLNGLAIDIMEHLYNAAKAIGGDVEVSSSKWKLSILGQDRQVDAPEFKMQIELNEVVENEKYQVSFSRKGGSEASYKAFNTMFKNMRDNV